MRVVTRDGWTLKPKLKLAVASNGDWTGTLGINEVNLLGTGNQVYLAYVKEIDRHGLNTTLDLDRMFGSEIDLLLNYAGMSDGKNANWVLGRPFRNTESSESYEWDGSRADQDVLRYRAEDTPDGVVLDTTTYRRDAFINNLTAALASRHSTGDHLRWGATVDARNESFFQSPEATEMAEDSVYGTVSAWAEISKIWFQQLRKSNGFGTEDLDLSARLRLTTTLAPTHSAGRDRD